MFNLNSNQDLLFTNQMLLSALVATSINPGVIFYIYLKLAQWECIHYL